MTGGGAQAIHSVWIEAGDCVESIPGRNEADRSRQMDAEKQLAEYSDEFYSESPFVPFPTVDAVIEAITETGVQVIPCTSRIEFYEAIIERIQAEIDKENRWYDED